MGNSLQSKLKTTVFAFMVTVLLIWTFFFLYTLQNLTKEAKKNASQTSEQIISILEDQFYEIERISFILSQSDIVKDFVTEKEILPYHEKAENVNELLKTSMKTNDYVEHLIIYSDNKAYYRFVGNMGNTFAQKIYWSIKPSEKTNYFDVNFDGIRYIAYVTGIYSDGTPQGSIVLLIEESKLLSLFHQYQQDFPLHIYLAADDKVILTTDRESNNVLTEDIRSNSDSIVSSNIDFTPFEIIVGTNQNYMWKSISTFTVTMGITVIIILFMSIIFARFLRLYFFTPMLDIMNGIELLGMGSQTTLPMFKEENFNKLACKINMMLQHLDDRNKTIFETSLQLKNLELEKQKTIIVSLKKQISAHFTVNVLGAIKRLATIGELVKTSEMCDGLSYLIRYANDADEYINGLEEFFVLQKYVDIMQIRYPGHFHAVLTADEKLGDIKMPRMLLQPLVENAIIHGLQKDGLDGKLFVSAKFEQNLLIFMVEDNGIGMPIDKLESLSNRLNIAYQLEKAQGLEQVALLNIKRRIHAYYGGESGIRIESIEGKGTKVELVIDNIELLV